MLGDTSIILSRSFVCSLPRRKRCIRASPFSKLNLFGIGGSKTSTRKATLDKLLKVVDQTQRGVAVQKEQLAEIKQIFAELENTGSIATEEEISGTWRLLWTTEKETLFILENAKIFGTLAGDVFQIIDKAGNLQNVIEFPPEGSFVVNSSLDWQGNGRTNFKFTAATLNLPKGRKLKLPPFGQGWFESICIDNRYRLSRDSRGDMLFVVKEGPPRKWE